MPLSVNIKSNPLPFVNGAEAIRFTTRAHMFFDEQARPLDVDVYSYSLHS